MQMAEAFVRLSKEYSELEPVVRVLAENRWPSFRLGLATPASGLDVAFRTDRDPRPRALAARRPSTGQAPPMSILLILLILFQEET